MDDLIVSGLRIDWSMLADSYASRIPSLRSLDELGFRKNVTFLVGENGSGKSTLLEAIAVVCGFWRFSCPAREGASILWMNPNPHFRRNDS